MIPSVNENGEQLKLFCMVGGKRVTLENRLAVSYKLNVLLPNDLTIPLLLFTQEK